MPDGINADALAILAGQLAGAVAPGSMGAAFGQVGAQAGQANVMAKRKGEQQEQLMQLINQLTGSGAQTTGLTVGEGGEIKFTGKVAPKTDEVEIQSKLDTQPKGGGNQTTSTFYNLLGEQKQLPLLA